MIVHGMGQAGSAVGVNSSGSVTYRESIGFVIGRKQAGQYYVDSLESIEAISASRCGVRFSLGRADLPPDTLGFFHTHRRTVCPSARDLISYVRLARNLQRELLFLLFSSQTGAYSAVRVSSGGMIPVPVARLCVVIAPHTCVPGSI